MGPRVKGNRTETVVEPSEFRDIAGTFQFMGLTFPK